MGCGNSKNKTDNKIINKDEENKLINNKKESIKVNKYLFLLGPPGSGKGTFGKLLIDKYELEDITVGDLLRKLVSDENNKSDEIEELRTKMKKGELVNDSTIINVVSNHLHTLNKSKKILFDGIPRNVEQVKLLSEKIDLSESFVVNIMVKDDILIELILGRLSCNKCNKAYNSCNINRDGYELGGFSPKEENNCDICHEELSKRADDNKETIKNRLKLFKESTFPVIEEFKSKNIKVLDFEPKKGANDFNILLDMINKHKLL